VNGFPTNNRQLSAYFNASIEDFVDANPDQILGVLTRASEFSVELTQRDAWEQTIRILQGALQGVSGAVFLEFDVPRLGSRIDAVVVSGPAIIPIEMKCGATTYVAEHRNQAWDYALDLRNFHKASHDAPVFPLLVATAARRADQHWSLAHADGVRPPFLCNASGLRGALESALSLAQGPVIDVQAWARAPYHPTPTIVEAARALYSRHSVEAITRNDAGARNLRVTSRSVERVIASAMRNGEKAIVFVTGVPGAGKTLVGLNVATARRNAREHGHAVFLSGNAPLVAVLREALTRDELQRRKNAGERARKSDAAQPVKQFIQNVHHFRDEGVRSDLAPHDHVVIFDEAQRAWNREQTSRFMRQRKGQPGFSQSEPEFLIGYMDRHRDWAVIVCLVGGGQEIHTGEAGIGAWLDAVRDHFPDWQVHVSPRLTDSEYAAGSALNLLRGHRQVVQDESFHLATSMRSFRAETVSAFVKSVLDCEVDGARALHDSLGNRYPIALTRDLGLARRWLRDRARGNESYGLVASSQAMRLKPHAIDVRVSVDPVHWFLGRRDDTRSSYYLEDAATEFQVQGLELDWVCVTWDADLRTSQRGWTHHAFRGSKWQDVHKVDRQQYLLNAYRVLLTRARQGMVIFVPPGDPEDSTRRPAYYDSTFEYLRGLGLPMLD
jgi:hypothetical protein